MLGNPYKLIAEIGLNKYYLLEGNNTLYLATESIFEVEEDSVADVGADHFTQGLKLLKITPTLFFLFNVFANSPVTGEHDDGSPKYSFMDMDKFRESLQDMVKDFNSKTGDNLKIDTPTIYDNDVVMGLVEEHNPILYVHGEDTRTDIVYLVSENSLGLLRLYAITTFNVGDHYEVVTIDSYNYNLETVKTVVDKILDTQTQKEAQA